MGAPAPPLLRRGAIPGVICLALSLAGCVLPVAPEFQDPPATQNLAPVIIEATPQLGMRVATPDFSVTVQDPNVGDNLYVRFVADYPPLSSDTKFLWTETVSRRPDGALLAQEVSPEPGTITCRGLAKSISHQLTVIVADRPFLLDETSPTQPADPTSLPPDAKSVVGSWTLDLDCH